MKRNTIFTLETERRLVISHRKRANSNVLDLIGEETHDSRPVLSVRESTPCVVVRKSLFKDNRSEMEIKLNQLGL